MGPGKHATAKLFYYIAVRIKPDDWIEIGVVTIGLASSWCSVVTATDNSPQVLTISINVDTPRGQVDPPGVKLTFWSRDLSRSREYFYLSPTWGVEKNHMKDERTAATRGTFSSEGSHLTSTFSDDTPDGDDVHADAAVNTSAFAQQTVPTFLPVDWFSQGGSVCAQHPRFVGAPHG